MDNFGVRSHDKGVRHREHDQLGVYDQVSGILLELLKEKGCSDLTVVKTHEIGHGRDVKAIKIGGEVNFLCL